jgi:hypothetical protein
MENKMKYSKFYTERYINVKKKRKMGVKPMTVCIAAICDAYTENPKIIFAADRLVSAGIQFEHGIEKVYMINYNCYVMISSNDSLKTDMIVKRVESKVSGKGVTVEETAKAFAKECEEQMKYEREKAILPKYGLSYDELIKKSSSVSEYLMKMIYSDLSNWEYEFKAQFLVLGIDINPYNPHIFIVQEDGDYKAYDYIGFATIGSGSDLAFPELAKFVYHPNINMDIAISRVYNAKKVAERVQGVGKWTDLHILHVYTDKTTKEKSIIRWDAPEDFKSVLDRGILQMQAKENETYAGIYQELQDFWKKTAGKTTDVIEAKGIEVKVEELTKVNTDKPSNIIKKTEEKKSDSDEPKTKKPDKIETKRRKD